MKAKYIIFFSILLLPFVGLSQGGFTKPNNSYGTIMNRLRPDSTLLLPTGCGTPSGLAGTRSTFQRMAAIYMDSCNAKAYVFNPKDSTWIDITETGGGGGTTIRFDTIGCDIHIFAADTLRAIIKQPNGLQAGTGIVSYTGTGFNFFVTAATYQLECVGYQTNDTTVTLPAADGTFPRFDMIFVDTTGTVRIRSGDPSPNPAQPGFDSDHEIPLTYILVPAGATTPSLTTEIIYNENTEWTGATGGTITANFNDTGDPFLGTKNVNTTGAANNSFLEFTRGTPTQINDKDGVVLFIRLKGTLSNNQNIRLQFYNGATPVGNLITLPLNKSSLVYQGHSITTASLGVGTAAINKFRVIYAGNATYTAGFNLDYVYLQNGITQVTGDVILTGDVSGSGALGSPVPTTLSNTGVTAGTYGATDSIPVITVDAKGRVLNAFNVAVPTGGGADSSIFATNYRLDTVKANIRAEIPAQFNPIAGAKITLSGSYPNITFDAKDLVDTIYRKPGQDSIFFTINGIERAIKDSVGGGGGGVPIDSVAIRRIGVHYVGYNSGFGGAGNNGGSSLTNSNIWIGLNSGAAITSGIRNIGIGQEALEAIQTSNDNIAIGFKALEASVSTTSGPNVAVGGQALRDYTGNGNMTAIGHRALEQATTAVNMTGLGYLAGVTATGNDGTYIGANSGIGATGIRNTAIGSSAANNGYSTGTLNVSIGFEATASGTGVTANAVHVGAYAGRFTNDSRSTYLGYFAGGAATGSRHTGNDNTAIGYQAMYDAGGVRTGTYNIVIGSNLTIPSRTSSNQVTIGGNSVNWLQRFTGGGWLFNNTGSAVTTQTASTYLEINGTAGAFLLPRLTAAQITGLTATDGMMVFCTDCTADDASTGVSQTYSSGAWRNHY